MRVRLPPRVLLLSAGAPWRQAIVDEHAGAFVRGLLHSDGCRSVNTIRHPEKTSTYVRYQFSNRSDDIRGIFTDALDQLGIPWRPMGRWQVSVARREGVARLDELVGPKR